jgi:hypothetical protein
MQIGLQARKTPLVVLRLESARQRPERQTEAGAQAIIVAHHLRLFLPEGGRARSNPRSHGLGNISVRPRPAPSTIRNNVSYSRDSPSVDGSSDRHGKAE